MRKIISISLLALVALTAAAGCASKSGDVQEVITEVPAPTTPSAVEPSTEQTDMQKRIEELERRLAAEEAEEKQAIEDYLSPTTPPPGVVPQETPTETPTEGTPEETPPETPPETPEDATPPVETPEDAPSKPGTVVGPVITPGALGPLHTIFPADTTPPTVGLAVADTDNNAFVVVFSEYIDFASIVERKSIVVSKKALGFPVNIAGSLVTDDGVKHKIVKFMANEAPKFDRNSNGQKIPTTYTVKIFGADSADPSRAVKDRAGNEMTLQSEWELTCVETPEYLQLSAMHCD